MNRRGFLGAILAGAAAPAVVKAESLMKIWVPPEPKIWTLSPIGKSPLEEFIAEHKKGIETSIFMAAPGLFIPGDLIQSKDKFNNIHTHLVVSINQFGMYQTKKL